MKAKLILASASPRRRDILQMLGYEFSVIPAKGEEQADFSDGAPLAARQLAEGKAGEVAALHGGVVLGSDTIVELRGRVFGKPRDEQEACRMLRSLSGGVHRVHTGVCVTDGPAAKSFVSTAEVEFYPLSDRIIEAYVRTGDPMDKAGAYGIQGPGCVLVKRINGDFYTIMGLPAAETARLLGSFGIFPPRR